METNEIKKNYEETLYKATITIDRVMEKIKEKLMTPPKTESQTPESPNILEEKREQGMKAQENTAIKEQETQEKQVMKEIQEANEYYEDEKESDVPDMIMTEEVQMQGEQRDDDNKEVKLLNEINEYETLLDELNEIQELEGEEPEENTERDETLN